MPPGTWTASGRSRRRRSPISLGSAALTGLPGSDCGCRRTASSTRRRRCSTSPTLAIADARHKHERPKVERHGDCLLTAVPTARYVDTREEVEFGELFFYVGRDYIVTVRYGQAAPLKDVRAELENHPDVLRHGPGGGVAGRTLARRPGLHARHRRSRERRPRGRARRLQRVARPADTAHLLPDPRSARLPHRPRAAGTGDEASHRPGVHPLGRPRDRPAVPRRRRALAEIVERGRSLHHLLSNALAASNTQASIRQNEDTRRISAWVAIGVVPTVIGGSVRDEPRRHSRRRTRPRLRDRHRHHRRAVRLAVPSLQAARLVVAGAATASSCGGTRGTAGRTSPRWRGLRRRLPRSRRSRGTARSCRTSR